MQQLAEEETKVRACAASRNISAETCDVVVAIGFSLLEALSCLCHNCGVLLIANSLHCYHLLAN